MKRTALLVALIMVSVLSGADVFAADNYRVSNGAKVAIYEYAKYRNVKNNCGKDIFVPTKTAAEWQSFIDHHPACAIIGVYDCADSGAVSKTDSTGKYCLWSKTLYIKKSMPKNFTVDGTATLQLPAGYSSARLDYAGFDDAGEIKINGLAVCQSSAPGTDPVHPQCLQYCHGSHSLSGIAKSGGNTVTAHVINSCGDDMAGGVDIRFTPPK